MAYLSTKLYWFWLLYWVINWTRADLSILQDLAEEPKFSVNFTDSFIGETSTKKFMDPNNVLPGLEDGLINGSFSRRIKMKTNEGRKYLCDVNLPQGAPEPAESKTPSNEELINIAQNEGKAGTVILDSLEGKCLLMQTGWWTYKFCFNGEVTQFHLPTLDEAKNEAGLTVFVLGRYSNPLPILPAEDRVATIGVEDGSISAIVKSTPSKNILVQRWGGGTACSLNNQPRSVDVHYLCLPGQPARIVSVKEPRSCHYLVEISTPQLCQKSLFAEKKKPNVYPIHCLEIVPDDIVEIKTKEAAAKRAAARSNRFSELEGAQTSKASKLPQIQYLARFSKDGNQPNVIALLDEQLKPKTQPSPPDSNPQLDSGEDNEEKSPDVPGDDLYGTISKILDLIKHEITPVKPESEEEEDGSQDEL